MLLNVLYIIVLKTVVDCSALRKTGNTLCVICQIKIPALYYNVGIGIFYDSFFCNIDFFLMNILIFLLPLQIILIIKT